MNKLDIVKQARTWIGTPFHHQGRLKHKGADCIGILVGVLKDLNVPSDRRDNKGEFIPLYKFDDIIYSKNPNGLKLQRIVGEYLKEKVVEDIQPGDVVLMCWAKYPQHVAYISDYGTELGLIHSYLSVGKCVEHGLNDSWKSRIVSAYEVVLNG